MKVLALCDDRFKEKYHYNARAEFLSSNIRKLLTEISLAANSDDQENQKKKEELYQCMVEFGRNCRKRKLSKNPEANLRPGNRTKSQGSSVDKSDLDPSSSRSSTGKDGS